MCGQWAGARRASRALLLRRNDFVISGLVIESGDEAMEIMSISELGYGKRTRAGLYKQQSRGGLGIINFKVTTKTGKVVGALPVKDGDGLILLTSANKVVRCAVDEISSYGRSTSGVIVVRLDDGATVVACDRLLSRMESYPKRSMKLWKTWTSKWEMRKKKE